MTHPMMTTEEIEGYEEWARGRAEVDELQQPDYDEMEAEYQSALPSLEEFEAPFADEPAEEVVPFGLQIDGHKLAPILTYDDAGRWLDILAAHFPEVGIGMVLA